LVKAGQQALQDSQKGAAAAGGAGRRQQASRVRLAAAHYVIGLGYLGLDELEKAKEEISLALKTSPDHLGARTALAALK
jgi:Tfp pilus assembly protein PilF